MFETVKLKPSENTECSNCRFYKKSVCTGNERYIGVTMKSTDLCVKWKPKYKCKLWNILF